MDVFSAMTVAIVFASLLAGLVIICVTITKLVGNGGGRASGDDDARLIQEIHQIGRASCRERV